MEFPEYMAFYKVTLDYAQYENEQGSQQVLFISYQDHSVWAAST